MYIHVQRCGNIEPTTRHFGLFLPLLSCSPYPLYTVQFQFTRHSLDLSDKILHDWLFPLHCTCAHTCIQTHLHVYTCIKYIYIYICTYNLYIIIIIIINYIDIMYVTMHEKSITREIISITHSPFKATCN